MRARLNIFSGLPDPEWTLPPESARALQERFHALLQQSVAQDTQVPDHLGYRGIEILPDPGDTIGKTLAVAWIFTGLTYLLIPVLHRFATARTAPSDERVIASLDDVELVLTRSRDGLEVELDPGERLILRRRESGFRPVGSDPG